jgi:hypothetical protein
MSQKLNAAIAVIGIDIGKNSFHIVGHDHRGAIVLRQKLVTRPGGSCVPTPFRRLEPCDPDGLSLLGLVLLRRSRPRGRGNILAKPGVRTGYLRYFGGQYHGPRCPAWCHIAMQVVAFGERLRARRPR